MRLPPSPAPAAAPTATRRESHHRAQTVREMFEHENMTAQIRAALAGAQKR